MTFPTYFTGTVSIDNGGTVVVGADTQWQRANVRAGDTIIIDPASGHPEISILSVDSITQLTLMQPWTHGGKIDVSYIIKKGSIARILTPDDNVFRDVDRAISALNASGYFVFVPSDATEPDVSIGDEGQYALQPATGKMWFKENGDWIFLGIYAAVTILGIWAVDVTYTVNNVVTRNGKAYYAKRETLGDPPESSPDDWGVLVENGDLYLVAIDAIDRPASGEVWRHTTPIPVTFPATLGESAATAAVAATAEAVFSLRKSGVEFATMTFAASAATATFACAADTTFAAYDVLTIIAPSPRDDALSGLAATIVAYR